MVSDRTLVAVAARRGCGKGLRSAFRASSRCSLRYRRQYSGHPHQVRRRHRELEVLIDAPDAPVDGLTDAPDRLAPAEVLFDALAHDLAEPVTGVPGRARVDRAASVARVIARHMRRHPAIAASLHKVVGVVTLVGSQRPGPVRRDRIEHGQRRDAFAKAIGVRDHRTDHEPRSILHQRMALVALDRRRVVALAELARVRVRRAGMRVVAAPLALPVGLRVAPRPACHLSP